MWNQAVPFCTMIPRSSCQPLFLIRFSTDHESRRDIPILNIKCTIRARTFCNPSKSPYHFVKQATEKSTTVVLFFLLNFQVKIVPRRSALLSEAPAMPPPTPVRIGVLLIGPSQLLDVSPIDLFGMLTKPYLTACRLPTPLIAHAVPIDIIYISESGAGSIIELTASAGLRVTASLTDISCAPGNLEILMIPGPDPSCMPSEAVKLFMREHAEVGADVLMICTGVFMAGHAGLLDGKRATGPRALLPELRKKFPRAKFEAKRWMRDGTVWTSGMFTPVPSPFERLDGTEAWFRLILKGECSGYRKRTRHGG